MPDEVSAARPVETLFDRRAAPSVFRVMTEKDGRSAKGGDQRARRLAQALRANLRLRKAQARAGKEEHDRSDAQAAPATNNPDRPAR